jgi:hypothetical protein
MVKVTKIKPRHIARFDAEVQRLLDEHGDQPVRDPHELLMRAARTELPMTPKRHLRVRPERNTAFRDTVLRCIRTNDIATAYQIFCPRRRPQNTQPLIGVNGENLVTDQEKADAGVNLVVDTLYNNTATVAAEFDTDEMKAVAHNECPELQIAEVQYAQRRTPRKTARDKHGVAPMMLKILSPTTAHRLLKDEFHEILRGNVSKTMRNPRIALIPKPGKRPELLCLRRPVTIQDAAITFMDRIMNRRMAVDAAKAGNVAAQSQMACRLNVPVDLQVHAAVAHANNKCADGQMFFEVGSAAVGGPPGKFRNFNAAINTLVPAEISNQFLPPVESGVGRKAPPVIGRVCATRCVCVDMSSAYCRLPINSALNRMAKFPEMRKHIPYCQGLNGPQYVFVQEGSAKSNEKEVRVGVAQGRSSSGQTYTYGTAENSETFAKHLDFNSEILDDENGLKFGRCPLVRDGAVQRALNDLNDCMDAQGLLAAEEQGDPAQPGPEAAQVPRRADALRAAAQEGEGSEPTGCDTEAGS